MDSAIHFCNNRTQVDFSLEIWWKISNLSHHCMFLGVKCSAFSVDPKFTVEPPRCLLSDTNAFEDVCTFKCASGYKPVDPDNMKATCLATRQWSITLPKCNGKIENFLLTIDPQNEAGTHGSAPVPVMIRTNASHWVHCTRNQWAIGTRQKFDVLGSLIDCYCQKRVCLICHI